jgi:hypothetical protein
MLSADKMAMLDDMVVTPPAIPTPAAHTADWVITVRRMAAAVRAPGVARWQISPAVRNGVSRVAQPVRDSDGSLLRGPVVTTAPMSQGPARRTATAT